MTRIVTSTYRYKRPPRRKKSVAFEVPAVVRADSKPPTGRTRRPVEPKVSDDTTFNPQRTLAAVSSATTARQPAIVTIRRKPERILPPDLLPETPEEHQRRGDAADALWRELVRRISGKERP